MMGEYRWQQRGTRKQEAAHRDEKKRMGERRSCQGCPQTFPIKRKRLPKKKKSWRQRKHGGKKVDLVNTVFKNSQKIYLGD